MHIQLGLIDYFILIAYTAFVVGIGFALKRYMKSSSDFLTSGRSIPTWVTGLAFISANLGALELVGMAASGAKYGIATAHFVLHRRDSRQHAGQISVGPSDGGGILLSYQVPLH